MNRLAVVVLNWNGMSDTIECIASLRKQSQAHTIILVDNNSQEKLSVDMLDEYQKRFKEEVVVIKNDQNLGFAGGVNTGIRYALSHNFSHVALLNNDAIVDKDWLKILIESASKTKAGITTCLLLHRDGKTIDSTGDWYSVWGLPFPRARNQPKELAPDSGYVFGASGGASLYSAEMLRDIGLFDETFFAYYEDVDISFRAQLAGYSVYFEKGAIAYHKQGASSAKIPGFTILQTMKNLPILFIKNVPAGILLKIGIRFWLAYYLFLLNAISKGSGIAALKGWLASIPLFWIHGINERRHIQHTKKVTTQYIKDLLFYDLPPEQTGLRKLRSFFITSK